MARCVVTSCSISQFPPLRPLIHSLGDLIDVADVLNKLRDASIKADEIIMQLAMHFFILVILPALSFVVRSLHSCPLNNGWAAD